jgi:choline dehydrogenase-like flavoprotein
MGAAGGVIAAELAKAGMTVIGLERGPRRGHNVPMCTGDDHHRPGPLTLARV